MDIFLAFLLHKANALLLHSIKIQMSTEENSLVLSGVPEECMYHCFWTVVPIVLCVILTCLPNVRNLLYRLLILLWSLQHAHKHTHFSHHTHFLSVHQYVAKSVFHYHIIWSIDSCSKLNNVVFQKIIYPLSRVC